MNNRTTINLASLLTDKIADWEPHFSALGIPAHLFGAFQNNPMPNLYKLYMNCVLLLQDARVRNVKVKIRYGWQLWSLCDEERFIQLTLENISSLMPTETPEGLTPFHHIALTGNANNIVLMLKQVPHALIIKDNHGVPVIHYAMLSGSLATTDYILNNYPGLLDIKSDIGTNLLQCTVRSGKIDAIQRAIEKLPSQLDVCDKDGHNSLFSAALSGSLEAFTYLETHYPALKDKKGKHSLVYAAYLSGNKNLILHLKNEPIDVDVAHAAALSNDIEIIENLLKIPAFKQLQAESKNAEQIIFSLMNGALINENLRFVKLFLEKYPASHAQVDDQEFNLLMRAAYYSSVEIVSFLVQKFPDQLHDLSISDATILHLAATRASEEMLDFFIKKLPSTSTALNIDGMLKRQDILGKKISHYAAQKGSLKTLDYCVRLLYDLHGENYENDKISLILSAAESGSIKKTVYCLELANNPNDGIEDENDITIIHAAACHPSLLEYLYMKYPLLMKNSWQKDGCELTPDEEAIRSGNAITPSQIKMLLIKKATANLLNGNLSNEQIYFLSVFSKRWRHYLRNERGIAEKLISNKIIIPDELKVHLNNYMDLLQLTAIKTEDEILTLSLLTKLILLALDAHETMTPKSMWKTSPPKLIVELKHYISQCAQAMNDELSHDMLLTIRVIINNSNKITYHYADKEVVHVLLGKLLATANLSAIVMPKHNLNNNLEILEADFGNHHQTMLANIQKMSMDAKIKNEVLTLFLPSLKYLIDNMDEISAHYVNNPKETYYFPVTKIPLHTDSEYISFDVRAFRELFTKTVMELFAAFYHCKTIGKLIDYYERLTRAECFNARSRCAITYAGHTSDVKSINAFMEERYEEYKGFQSTMHTLSETEFENGHFFKQFICDRYLNHQCIVDEQFAPDGKITAEGVSRYIEEVLCMVAPKKRFSFW